MSTTWKICFWSGGVLFFAAACMIGFIHQGGSSVVEARGEAETILNSELRHSGEAQLAEVSEMDGKVREDDGEIMPDSLFYGVDSGIDSRQPDGVEKEVRESVIPEIGLAKSSAGGGAGIFIERSQALDVAFEAVGNAMNVEKETADVIREGNNYVVTFPARPAPQMTSGSRWRGPDYAARLIVDGRTGAVLEMKVAP